MYKNKDTLYIILRKKDVTRIKSKKVICFSLCPEVTKAEFEISTPNPILTSEKSQNQMLKSKEIIEIILDKIINDTDYDEKYRDISLQNNLHPSNKFNRDTINTIKNYYLQWKYQKPIQKFIGN